MAQVKISALTAADPLTGVEEAPFVQGGATKKATAEQIREYVASQPNVFSVTQRIEDAAPALQFSENDTVDKNWEFIGVAGALRLDELSDAFATTGTHATFTHGGGVQVGSPTGGDQGAGTVNATGLYENGTGVAKLSGGADANFTAMPQVGGDDLVKELNTLGNSGQSWQDVSGSRSGDTVFTNTTGRPILVSISHTSTQNDETTLEVDSITVCSFIRTSSDTHRNTFVTVVPDGSTYELVNPSAIQTWSELR